MEDDRSTHLGDQLLEDVVTTFLHNRKRQSLPCLIIGSSMTGGSLAVFAPVEDALTRARPEAAGSPCSPSRTAASIEAPTWSRCATKSHNTTSGE